MASAAPPVALQQVLCSVECVLHSSHKTHRLPPGRKTSSLQPAACCAICAGANLAVSQAPVAAHQHSAQMACRRMAGRFERTRALYQVLGMSAQAMVQALEQSQWHFLPAEMAALIEGAHSLRHRTMQDRVGMQWCSAVRHVESCTVSESLLTP